MAQSAGTTVITNDGLKALAEAHISGIAVVPKYYRIAKDNYPASPTMTSADIPVYWREHDIDLYSLINDTTVEFSIVLEAIDSIEEMKTICLFLDDGTLLSVTNLDYPLPKSIRQVAKIQIAYNNIEGIFDFKYLPHQETEQDLGIINSTVVTGNQIFINTLKLEKIKFEGIIR